TTPSPEPPSAAPVDRRGGSAGPRAGGQAVVLGVVVLGVVVPVCRRRRRASHPPSTTTEARPAGAVGRAEPEADGRLLHDVVLREHHLGRSTSAQRHRCPSWG